MSNKTPTHSRSFPCISEADKQAFVAYYNEHNILPVSQDIEDPDFKYRRSALYNMLGIPLSSLRGRSIIEFGPGGGFNATAITHHLPELYVFVDGSRKSIMSIVEKGRKGLFGNRRVEVIESNIFDYSDTRCFNLVVIEGVVPCQTRPREMIRHAASFVAQNGYLVTTTTATSYLSEVCRRLFRPFIIQNWTSPEEQVKGAVEIFAPHLKSLRAKTRSTVDWVLDSIFHTWEKDAKVIFTLLDACKCLESEFDFYGSSPRFLIDDRFYKTINKSALSSNELVALQFPDLTLALLDYRVGLIDILKSRHASQLESLCMEAFSTHLEIVNTNSYSKLDEFMDVLKDIIRILPKVSDSTSIALNDFIYNFPKFLQNNKEVDFPEFSQWWGRGQQYVSFIRTQGYS